MDDTDAFVLCVAGISSGGGAGWGFLCVEPDGTTAQRSGAVLGGALRGATIALLEALSETSRGQSIVVRATNHALYRRLTVDLPAWRRDDWQMDEGALDRGLLQHLDALLQQRDIEVVRASQGHPADQRAIQMARKAAQKQKFEAYDWFDEPEPPPSPSAATGTEEQVQRTENGEEEQPERPEEEPTAPVLVTASDTGTESASNESTSIESPSVESPSIESAPIESPSIERESQSAAAHMQTPLPIVPPSPPPDLIIQSPAAGQSPSPRHDLSNRAAIAEAMALDFGPRLIGFVHGRVGEGQRAGPGGWAFLLVDRQTGRSLGRRGGEAWTTAWRMEITASIELLKALRGNQMDVEVRTGQGRLAKMCSVWMADWARRNWTKRGGEVVKNLDVIRQLHHMMSLHHIAWRALPHGVDSEGLDVVAQLSQDAVDAWAHSSETDKTIRYETCPVSVN